MGKKKNPRRVTEDEAMAYGHLIRVSPQKLGLLASMIQGKAAGEAAQPALIGRFGQGQGQKIGPRRRPHGGQVREIDPEQLARDKAGLVIGHEMDAGDQHVLGGHQVMALGNRQQGRVIGQTQGSGGAARQRRQQIGDQGELIHLDYQAFL